MAGGGAGTDGVGSDGERPWTRPSRNGKAPLPDPPRGGKAAPPPAGLAGCQGALSPVWVACESGMKVEVSQSLGGPGLAARSPGPVAAILAPPPPPDCEKTLGNQLTAGVARSAELAGRA
jgi:hypothetical protein